MAYLAMMTKKSIFMLTPEEHDWLRRQAEVRQVSMASIVRELIREAQARREQTVAEKE